MPIGDEDVKRNIQYVYLEMRISKSIKLIYILNTLTAFVQPSPLVIVSKNVTLNYNK